MYLYYPRKTGFLALLFATILASLPAGSCLASVASGGKVTAYFVDDSGLIFFDTDGSRTAKPGCANPAKNNFSFKADTLPRQAMFASIITAYSTGRTVMIGGTGACTNASDVETAANIILQ